MAGIWNGKIIIMDIIITFVECVGANECDKQECRFEETTNWNNVATQKRKKVLAPDSPGAKISGAESAAPKRTRLILMS